MYEPERFCANCHSSYYSTSQFNPFENLCDQCALETIQKQEDEENERQRQIEEENRFFESRI